MSVILAVAGTSIFLLLGVAHAVLAFQSRPDAGPLMPTSPAVRAAMGEVDGLGMAPDIESTLYRAWIGFNLSHSLGIVVTAAIVLTHALTDFGQATSEAWFLVVIALVPFAYFVMAVKYWFDKPRDAIAFASVLLWVGTAIEVL